MPRSDSAIPLDTFQTFGDLLKYLRRRARLTQRELSIAVGYSEAQISRLEQNQRPPELTSLTALFIPALFLEDEPLIVTRLMELAAQARGEEIPPGGVLTFSRSVQREVGETVRTIEEGAQNNLPLQLTSFIGRVQEIIKIKNLLDPANGKARLVTLTGSGGCGKTRLALEIAKQVTKAYGNGIWFVELAPILDPDLVLQTVTSALGVPETLHGSPMSALTRFLQPKQILLILDNCEQVISGVAGLVEEVLRTCPQVHILVTSREILKLTGEVQFRVPSLSIPNEESPLMDELIQSEAMRLFVERAQAILPSFTVTNEVLPAIAQICQLVDGMPLGIELAAPKIAVLTPGQIATRLGESFQVLGGSRTKLARHQTLEATIRWSYELLSDAEQRFLQRLSVFSGGWTLESAEAITSDESLIPKAKVLDLLSQLENKSLVIVKWGTRDKVRYTMLQTIREFVREKFRSSEEIKAIRARHFEYFFSMAQRGEENLFVADSSIDWAETEIDNLRTALTWSLERDLDGRASDERTTRALELMMHVWPLWLNRGYAIEGEEWLNRLLAVHTLKSPARARALLLAGDFVGFRGDAAGKEAMIREALTLARSLGDGKRTAMAFMEMGLVERDRDNSKAIEFLIESHTLFQSLNETLWVYRTSFLLAETYMANEEFEIARRLWSEGLDLCRAKNDLFHIAWGLEGLGTLERLAGHLEQAGQLYTASLQQKFSVMDKMGIMFSLASFAQLAAAQKQFKRAAILWGAAERLGESLNLLLAQTNIHIYTSLVKDTRAVLGDDAFDAAWAEGKTLPMQQAVQFALDLP